MGRTVTMNGRKLTEAEIKKQWPFRMRMYDDDGNFIKQKRTVDPSLSENGLYKYQKAEQIADANEYAYGATHFRWYKGNKLVCVYLTEFGELFDKEAIAKGNYPPTNYVGGKFPFI